MDPLSISASVVSLVQLTSEVIKYLSDVKIAPKECRQCTVDAANLQNLLINLRYRLEEGKSGDPWFTAASSLEVENGPFDQYKQALDLLLSKVEVENSSPSLKKRLFWKFTKADIKQILESMDRLTSVVSLSLETDHL
jgi:hypothetical protein